MIESTYWRQELREELAWLKKHRKYRRWSEKQLVLYERRLMLVAFQVRSLLERPKVNDRAESPRVLRRLNTLRGLSHEQVEQVLT